MPVPLVVVGGLRRLDEIDQNFDEFFGRFAVRIVAGIFKNMEPTAGDGVVRVMRVRDRDDGVIASPKRASSERAR